jgi:hypothetical protein
VGGDSLLDAVLLGDPLLGDPLSGAVLSGVLLLGVLLVGALPLDAPLSNAPLSGEHHPSSFDISSPTPHPVFSIATTQSATSPAASHVPSDHAGAPATGQETKMVAEKPPDKNHHSHPDETDLTPMNWHRFDRRIRSLRGYCYYYHRIRLRFAGHIGSSRRSRNCFRNRCDRSFPMVSGRSRQVSRPIW